MLAWMMYPRLVDPSGREETREWIAKLVSTENAGGSVDAEEGEVIKEDLPENPFGNVTWIVRDYLEWNRLAKEEEEMYSQAGFFKYEENRMITTLFKQSYWGLMLYTVLVCTEQERLTIMKAIAKVVLGNVPIQIVATWTAHATGITRAWNKWREVYEEENDPKYQKAVEDGDIEDEMESDESEPEESEPGSHTASPLLKHKKSVKPVHKTAVKGSRKKNDTEVVEPDMELDMDTIRRYFKRYDLDGSGTINNEEELSQLSMNLLVAFDMPLGLATLDGAVQEKVPSLASDPMDVDAFRKWFILSFRQ